MVFCQFSAALLWFFYDFSGEVVRIVGWHLLGELNTIVIRARVMAAVIVTGGGCGSVGVARLAQLVLCWSQRRRTVRGSDGGRAVESVLGGGARARIQSVMEAKQRLRWWGDGLANFGRAQRH